MFGSRDPAKRAGQKHCFTQTRVRTTAQLPPNEARKHSGFSQGLRLETLHYFKETGWACTASTRSPPEGAHHRREIAFLLEQSWGRWVTVRLHVCAGPVPRWPERRASQGGSHMDLEKKSNQATSFRMSITTAWQAMERFSPRLSTFSCVLACFHRNTSPFHTLPWSVLHPGWTLGLHTSICSCTDGLQMHSEGQPSAPSNVWFSFFSSLLITVTLPS